MLKVLTENFVFLANFSHLPIGQTVLTWDVMLGKPSQLVPY